MQATARICLLLLSSNTRTFLHQTKTKNPPRSYLVEPHAPHPREKSRAVLLPKCSPSSNNDGRRHTPVRSEDGYSPRPSAWPLSSYPVHVLPRQQEPARQLRSSQRDNKPSCHDEPRLVMFACANSHGPCASAFRIQSIQDLFASFSPALVRRF